MGRIGSDVVLGAKGSQGRVFIRGSSLDVCRLGTVAGGAVCHQVEGKLDEQFTSSWLCKDPCCTERLGGSRTCSLCPEG